MPNYRSSERSFQLITQAVGRSGRKDKMGEAIIQTYMPTHYAITLGARQDYELFYRKEMEMRKLQAYPPYTFMAAITLSGKNEENVIQIAYDTADYLHERFQKDGVILGPSTPYIAKVRDQNMRTVLVKFRNYELSHQILSDYIALFANKNSISVSINIDPYNF